MVDTLIEQGHQVVVDNVATSFLEDFDPDAKFYKMNVCDAKLTKIPVSSLGERISP